MLMQILGSVRSSKPARCKPASVSSKLKLNSDPHMSYGFLGYLHKSLLIKSFFITFSLKRNTQNPKHSSPAVSSRHHWPCRAWTRWEPSSGRRQQGHSSSPGASATTSVRGWGGQSLLPLLEHSLALGRGHHRQIRPPTCKSLKAVSSVSPLEAGWPALGCSPTSLSTQCSHLTYTQCQAVIYNLSPSPLM